MMDASLARPTPLTEQVRIGEINELGDELQVLAAVSIDPHNPFWPATTPARRSFPASA